VEYVQFLVPTISLTCPQIDAVLYYAPILFTQAGFTSKGASFLASGISGIVSLIVTICAQIWVDKWGRRFPLVGGGLAISACFMAIGALYASHGGKANGEIYLSGKAPQWAVVILIYMFVVCISHVAHPKYTE
jgi:MFS family permease